MPVSDYKYWSVSISWHILFYNSWIIMDRFKLKCQEEIAKLDCRLQKLFLRRSMII